MSMFEKDEFILKTKGTIPILLTSLHNGWLVSDHSRIESPFFSEKKDEINVNILLQSVIERMSFEQKVPYSLVCRVGKDFLTSQHVEDFIKDSQRNINEIIDKFGRCIVVDCHGFSSEVGLGSFDLVLGTCHQKTISGDSDHKLALFLSRNGYVVFLPGRKRLLGEKFTGGKLIKRCFGEFKDLQIDCIQLEISFRLRHNVDLFFKFKNDFAAALYFLLKN